MPRYLVELEGTIELDAQDALEAEDIAIDFIHGDVYPAELNMDIDVSMIVTNVKEAD